MALAMKPSRKTPYVLACLLTLVVARAHAAVTCPTNVTLAGTGTNDDLEGTDGDDNIVGGGGDDLLRGFAGSDCLNGGSFNDRLFGGPDDDELVGEGGNDLLDGGPGDDELNGGSNDDELVGGPGNDVLRGEGGADALSGGEGDDELVGGTGSDTLIGGEGADEIAGEGGDDTIIIKAGDVPTGRVETIDGDLDDDTAVFDFDPGDVLLPDFDVTDPETGGIYRFRSIEHIVVDGCGNGRVEGNELCDDGNRVSGDGCDPDCGRPAGCGNGVREANEDCDDGNRRSGDGCSSNCHEECGETECDDGDPCTRDECENDECVANLLPAYDLALCDLTQVRNACKTELSKFRQLDRKLKRVARILRLVGAGAPPAGLDRAHRIVLKIEARALRIVVRGKAGPTCAAAFDRRLARLSNALATLRTP